MEAITTLRRMQQDARRSAGVFVADVGRGLLEVGHNTLAVLGLGVVFALVFAVGRADLRTRLEAHAYEWLQGRYESRLLASGNLLASVSEPEAIGRATAADIKALARDQAAVARWIARRYKVAPEPISALVKEAWTTGQRAGIDPTLILAIMAIESSYNPFAQSTVGAQGLMQVLTKLHDDKYERFGGINAAFDPVTNLRVGTMVLKECIQRAGGVEAGLKFYVGAALLETDGGYAGRVLNEQRFLRMVADGQNVSLNISNLPAHPVAEPEAQAAGTPVDPADQAPADPAQVALLH